MKCRKFPHPIGLLFTAILSFAAVLQADQASYFDKPFDRAYEVEMRQRIIDQIDKYLENHTHELAVKRDRYWNRDLQSEAAYVASVEKNREKLKQITGFVDERTEPRMEAYSEALGQLILSETENYSVQAVRWPVFDKVMGEGLLLLPRGEVKAAVVAFPDADQQPETLVGWTDESTSVNPFAALLADNGVAVLIPVLVSREMRYIDEGIDAIPILDWLPESGPKRKLRSNLSNREIVWRQSFLMGRHVIGYELQRAAAGLDWFERRFSNNIPLGFAGYGEGGLLALYGAAVDPRVDVALVSGYFGPRENLYSEPTERLVWGLLKEFGDAEIASLILPRTVIIEHSKEPDYAVQTPMPLRDGDEADWFQDMALKSAIDGRIETRTTRAVRGEVERLRGFFVGSTFGDRIHFVQGRNDEALDAWSIESVRLFLGALGIDEANQSPGALPPPPAIAIDATRRQNRISDNLSAHLIDWGRNSDFDKYRFFQGDTSSPAAWDKSMEPYRKYFYEEIIGKLPDAENLSPLNVRKRKVMESVNWSGYEVVYDALPGVWGVGVLAVPKDIQEGEKRPVVVLQHGHGGMPGSYAKEGAYHNLMSRLCERGFIVFAAHVPFHFDVKRAFPVGATVYSFGVPQYQQAIRFLKTLDYVDADRMGYYGLSWGGRTALFIPPLVPEFKFAVSSCFFSDWPRRALNVDWTASNLYHEGFDLFKFGMGTHFGHAEMALMTAPRGFVVENGYYDTAVVTSLAAYDFAKIKRVYDLLGIGDRAQWHGHIGGHETHLDSLLPYIHRMLQHPVRPIGAVHPVDAVEE